MTTKTDITLPPLPPRDDVLPKLGDRAIGYSPVWNERSMLDYGAACARAAVAANRREYLDTLKLARAIVNGHRRDNPPEDSVEADRQRRMPSDEYLPNKLWEASQLHGDECIADALVRIRALLSRYGSSQPANFGQGETRMDADSSVKNEGDIGQPAAPVAQEPVAYMHTVIQDSGEPDQALSFSRDSFPLQGVAGFRSIGVVPLGIVAAQARPVPDDYARGRDAGWRYAMETVAEAMGGVPTECVLDVAAVRAQDREPESQIPAGWVFFTADFSMHQRTGQGSVMLMRDKAGTDVWHKLTEEMQETTDLYATGDGATLREAIEDATRAAKGSGDA